MRQTYDGDELARVKARVKARVNNITLEEGL
jgi:hypothetical protein